MNHPDTPLFGLPPGSASLPEGTRHILVYLESRDGKIKKPSLEALGEAQRLSRQCSGGVSAVLLGRDARSLAASLPSGSVFIQEDEIFQAFHLSEVAGAVDR